MKRTHKLKTDIVVAGGGTAGCAAAISAARMGHRVILLEKLTICGGLATAGNIFPYLPICDGHGKQLIHGISEEFLLASIKYGPGEINGDWRASKARYMVNFNPASFVLVLDELLTQAGVEIWFDTVVTNAITQEGNLTSVECYNKSGMHQIEADCFIDATGDADIAVSAGCPHTIGKSNMSGWTLEVSPDNEPGKLALNGGRGTEEDEMEGVSGRMISEFTLRSREILLASYLERWNAENQYNRTNLYPAVLPTMANVRRTRAIEGVGSLDGNSFWTEQADSVGLFPGCNDWPHSWKAWSIPYGSLLPKEVGNLLVAGRCIDSRGPSWDNTRLIPVTAQTGDIAGIAAGLAVQLNQPVQNLPIEELQKELSRQGHILSFEEAYGKDWKSIAEERLATQQAGVAEGP